MKAKAKTKELKAALAKLAALPGRDTGMAGNSIVTVEADSFCGIRLQRTTVQSMARINCEGEIEEEGRAAVPYMPLFECLSNCDGEESELTMDGRELKITSGRGIAMIGTWPEHEIIAPPPRLEGVEITLSHDELISTLKVSSTAMATDRSRPAFVGVCFRKTDGALSVFGCNGHRAHVCRIAALIGPIDPEEKGQRDYGILLPAEGVECVKKVFSDEDSDCIVTLGKDGIQFDAGEISLRLPVSTERAPFLDALLSPKPEIKFAVNRQLLLKSAKAISPISSSGDGSIKLQVARKEINLNANNLKARVERKVACESDGEGEYFIEAAYLTSLLECCELEKITLWITAKGKQLFYREGERDFLVVFRSGIVTPMRRK